MTRLNIVLNGVDDKNLEKVYEVLGLDKEIISKTDVIRQCIGKVAKMEKVAKVEKRHVIIPADVKTKDEVMVFFDMNKFGKGQYSIMDKITTYYE